MKKLLLTALSLVTISLSAQYVSESLVKHTEEFNQFFGSKEGSLNMEFLKQFSVGNQDTSYVFVMEIKNKDEEVTGSSIGGSLSGGSLIGNLFSANVSEQFKVVKDEKKVVLNQEEFFKLYKSINAVYKYVVEQETFGTVSNTIMVSDGIDQISFAGEYKPNNKVNKVDFFYRMGDKLIYKLDKYKFRRIIKVMRTAKESWLSILNVKS